MKKLSIVLSAAFAITALVSCNKEFDATKDNTSEAKVKQSGSIPFVLQANLPQTKTTLNPSTYVVSWADGDIVYAVTTDEEWGSGATSSAATAASFTYSGSELSFSTESTIADGSHTFYFVYEPSSQVKYHRSAATTFSLQATQSQNCTDATAHIKQNDVLAGKLTATTPAKLAKVDLAHVNALMQFNITNSTGAAATLTGFDITFTGGSIAGIETISFADATATASVTGSATNKITVNLTNGVIADGETLPIYFVMAPLADYTGDVTINVYNNAGGYFTKTSTISTPISFVAGSYNSTTVPVSGWVDPITFTRINDVSDLTNGDYKYVIVGKQSASSFGILTYGSLNSGKLNYVKAYDTLPSSTLDLANLNSIWSISVSTTEPKTATLYNAANDKYLIANSNLSFGDEGDASSFTVTSESNLFAFAKGANYLGVNKSSNYWRDYASSTLAESSGKVLALYRYWEESTLSYITLSGTYPTEFSAGDTFSYTGLVVTAHYTNGKKRVVTPTSVLEAGVAPDMSAVRDDVAITVSYTEAAVTKTVDYTIDIIAPSSFTVTWKIGANPYQTDTDIAGGSTLVIPSVPSSSDLTSAGFAGKTFMGWTADATVAANGAGITYASTSNTVSADITYYAVVATAGAAQEAVLNVKTYATTNSWTNSNRPSPCQATVNNVSFVASSTSGNNGKYYEADPGTWRFYTEGEGLNITGPTGSLLTSVVVSFSAGSVKTPANWTKSGTSSPLTYTPNSGIKTNTVRIARDAANVSFSNITVNYVPYTEYEK